MALYSHFADKAALLDSVSARWLLSIDALLDLVCQKNKDPLEKVQQDPELYKAFDFAVDSGKAFVEAHLKTMSRQVFGLVKEAIAAKKIHKEAPERIAAVLVECTVGFTHPKLVVQHLHEKREPLLRRTLEAVLAGLA